MASLQISTHSKNFLHPATSAKIQPTQMMCLNKHVHVVGTEYLYVYHGVYWTANDCKIDPTLKGWSKPVPKAMCPS